MTALPVILVQPSCPGDRRAKGAQFQLTCNLCRESHKTQVWLCFLVLSFLGISACAACMPDTAHVQTCLESLKPAIERSDAMLYAPSADDIKENCKMMSLRCYMLELMMVLNEEEVMNEANCIFDFNERLPDEDKPVGCPPCEAYSLKNSTVFLERLNNLLAEITTLYISKQCK
ncbi:interleukin-15-like [Plectropomus leopardus]|uniref:interleukin-15-like n=1 Tax=Plectropomus leopardus TaxID=160734 RepID=UPI001C4C9E61|nr:interleukin-15-like [Plectropomus leopardus]